VAAGAWASTYLGTAAREGVQVLRRRPWEDLGAAASEDVGVGGGRQLLGHGRLAQTEGGPRAAVGTRTSIWRGLLVEI
jgi:hypothetical protein